MVDHIPPTAPASPSAAWSASPSKPMLEWRGRRCRERKNALPRPPHSTQRRHEPAMASPVAPGRLSWPDTGQSGPVPRVQTSTGSGPGTTPLARACAVLIRTAYQGESRALSKTSSLFYSFFKSLVGKDVVVELKNDLSICGTLHSVDQYLNIKLTDISVTDPEKYPHMLSVKNCFIRGSVVRYVQLPADEVDTQLLQDAARKEATQQKQ
ncbi:unnamed protein product [Lampetra planeri]